MLTKTTLRDIPNRFYEIKTHPDEGELPPDAARMAALDIRHNRHMSFMLSKVQSPDNTTTPFDLQENEYEVAANSTVQVLSYKLEQGIEGVLETYGWYTDAGGDSNLLFQLKVAGSIIAPDGKHASPTPRTTADWSPSGESTAVAELCPVHVFVKSGSVIEIIVQNTSTTDAYPVWVRIRGRDWPIEAIGSHGRAYFNTQIGRIV